MVGFHFQVLPFLKIFVRDFSEPKKARKLKVCINMDNDWMYGEYQNRSKGSIPLGLCPLVCFHFQILPFLKIFVTDFSEPKKATKLRVCVNMHKDWMYIVYQNKGQAFITLGVMSLGSCCLFIPSF